MSPSPEHPKAPEDIYYYGGNIMNHFGHFITECLPRYWCYKQKYDGLKILVHAEKTLDYLFSLEWLAGFFSLLGIDRNELVVFNRPTRLPSLIVAGTSFEENHFAHRTFARFCNELGARHREDPGDDRPRYLTRAGFSSQMRTILGEENVARDMERAGFLVVSPEKLTIPQQTGLFSASRPTVGFVGSAFHNSIFCKAPIGIALSCNGDHSSNFYLMDKVNDARLAYVQTPGIVSEGAAPGHPALYRIRDPGAVSDFLIDLTRRRIWEETEEEPHGAVDVTQSFLLRTCHGTYLHIDRQLGIVSHGVADGSRKLPLVMHPVTGNQAVLTTPTKDCLTIERDNNQGPELFYRLVRNDNGTISLRHGYTGRYLSAITGDQIICDRLAVKEWEQFTPEPVLMRPRL
ncbi:hypothetical protein AA21291_2067 [Swaminathania salitolerans LMG 21291]|nr:hypothetical protein AA21291_2067 [Swaminathania salitolerans LMG 21291]